MRRPERLSKLPRIYTGGGRLPDGRALELIRDERDGLARFLLFNPRERTLEQPACIVQNHVEFFPVDDECWVRHVRLPRLPNFQSSLSQITDRVTTLFAKLGEDQSLLITAWVLSTWRQELSVSPRLFVRGSGADTVLAALDPVCWRSVRMFAASGTGTYPAALAPTLLVSVESPKVAHRLLGSTVSGQLLWRGGLLVDRRNGLAIGYVDDAKPMTGTLNILAEAKIELPAEDDFQDALMGWKMSSEAAEDLSITDPVLRNLIAAVSSSEDLAQRVRSAYERHQKPLNTEFDHEEETAVVAVLTDLVGERRPSVYVAEIARGAERWLVARGSYSPMSPRHIGEVLRRLAIDTERLGAAGRGIRLSAGMIARIQELGKQLKPEENTDREQTGKSAED